MQLESLLDTDESQRVVGDVMPEMGILLHVFLRMAGHKVAAARDGQPENKGHWMKA